MSNIISNSSPSIPGHTERDPAARRDCFTVRKRCEFALVCQPNCCDNNFLLFVSSSHNRSAYQLAKNAHTLLHCVSGDIWTSLQQILQTKEHKNGDVLLVTTFISLCSVSLRPGRNTHWSTQTTFWHSPKHSFACSNWHHTRMSCRPLLTASESRLYLQCKEYLLP